MSKNKWEFTTDKLTPVSSIIENIEDCHYIDGYLGYIDDFYIDSILYYLKEYRQLQKNWYELEDFLQTMLSGQNDIFSVVRVRDILEKMNELEDVDDKQ